jgi:hypothetical protein
VPPALRDSLPVEMPTLTIANPIKSLSTTNQCRGVFLCKNSNSQHVTERIVEKTHSLSIYIAVQKSFFQKVEGFCDTLGAE